MSRCDCRKPTSAALGAGASRIKRGHHRGTETQRHRDTEEKRRFTAETVRRFFGARSAPFSFLTVSPVNLFSKPRARGVPDFFGASVSLRLCGQSFFLHEAMSSFTSFVEAALSAKVKLPCALISRAARSNAPVATLARRLPRLTRLTPEAASSATVKGGRPASTLTGFL